MAPPLWTLLPTLARTVKHHKSVPNTGNENSGTHPIDIHPPSLFRFLSLLQHLERISTNTAQTKKIKLTTHQELPSTGIFFGLLPKGLILLGLPSIRYSPCLFFLSLPGFLGLPGFLLLRLPFPLDTLTGCSQLRLSSLFNPHLLSCHLMLDLFKILLQI